jgi:hypothetical protein
VARASRPLFPTPSFFVVGKAVSDGLFGRSRFWRGVLIAIFARRALSRVMQSGVKTVAIERIKPGETLVLRGVRARDLPS